ncbi:hypothetical protein [Streptomyces hebeiensis]
MSEHMGPRGDRPDAGPANRTFFEAFLSNHRTLVLGILASVAGITGAVGGAGAGADTRDVLAGAGIGALGLILTVASVTALARKPRRGAPKRPR